MSRKPHLDVLNHPVYGGKVLDAFGVTERELLGQGRHSRVFLLDKMNILRIYSKNITLSSVDSLTRFYREVDASTVKFDIPEINEFGTSHDFIFSIEKYLGKSMGYALETYDASYHNKLIDEYVRIIGEIQNLPPISKAYYGEVMGDNPIRTETWGEYMYERTMAMTPGSSLDELYALIPNFDKLFTAWEHQVRLLEDPEKLLVHGDIFPGNLIVSEDGSISSVIDFSSMTMVGDPRLDVVIALLQIDFTHFRQEQMRVVESKIRQIYNIDDEIFDVYSVFVYLYYSSDPRKPMRTWCHRNLARLVESKF